MFNPSNFTAANGTTVTFFFPQYENSFYHSVSLSPMVLMDVMLQELNSPFRHAVLIRKTLHAFGKWFRRWFADCEAVHHHDHKRSTT
jgi:hypothetical protein